MKRVPKTKPHYKGERLDRTSGERLLCHYCARLATHVACEERPDSHLGHVLDLAFCDEHLNWAWRKGKVLRKIRMLPEYRRYLGRLQRWKEAQLAVMQGTLL